MTVAALREECASRGLLFESLNKRGIIALLRQSDDADDSDRYMPVSYTHLTLPTIYSV